MVQSVEVQVGQVVAKDSVMLTLDSRVFSARVDQQSAHLDAMKRQFDEAVRELERAQNYFDQDLSSIHELEVAKINHDKSAAEFKTAEAELAQANFELQYASIRAPFKGVVLARHAEVGQVVVSEQSAPALLEFADVSRLKAVASVDAASVAAPKTGKKASFRFRGKTLQGEVQSVGLEPLPGKAPRYPAYVVFDSQEMLIPIGTSIKLQIP